jgi:hypothetical protein
MALGIPTAVRNTLCAAFTGAIDAGAAGGTIDIRTGSKPTTPNDAATGTLLATFTLDPVSFGAPSTGVATLDVSPAISTTGLAAGTAGWARIKDSTGASVGDITVGTSGTDMIMDNAVIAVGQTLNLTAGTVTQPAA